MTGKKPSYTNHFWRYTENRGVGRMLKLLTQSSWAARNRIGKEVIPEARKFAIEEFLWRAGLLYVAASEK